jgi:antitoxin ParD1/3/4/toxin ParE1/3/4
VKRVELSEEAKQDLVSIIDYLRRQASAAITRYVLREIRAAIQFLARNPGAGHLRRDLTYKAVLFWPVFSYLIIYSEADGPLRVVRILHGGRDVRSLLR